MIGTRILRRLRRRWQRTAAVVAVAAVLSGGGASFVAPRIDPSGTSVLDNAVALIASLLRVTAAETSPAAIVVDNGER